MIKMDKRNLTWIETSKLVLNESLVSEDGLSGLITKARQRGIGKPITFQKTEYSENDFQKISVLIKWWNLLNTKTLVEFRDKATNETIQNIIIDTILEKKPLTIYSIFCPSYKKGIGAIGYTGVIGNHTKQLIKEIASFIYQSREIGINTKGLVYFSNLLLENLDLLKNTEYKSDLENNFEFFKHEFKLNDPENLINVELLSGVEVFNSQIGEKGITDGNIAIPDEIYDLVLNRNKIFYKNNLGWNDQQVEVRTKILARSYAFMGSNLNKIFPNGIMFWVESAYERGRMYNGMDQNNPLAIIYPIKND